MLLVAVSRRRRSLTTPRLSGRSVSFPSNQEGFLNDGWACWPLVTRGMRQKRTFTGASL